MLSFILKYNILPNPLKGLVSGRTVQSFRNNIYLPYMITYLRGLYSLLVGKLWLKYPQFISFIFITLILDAIGSDEEPLWEPIEWSMVQVWVLFILIFAWFAEGLILSRYGGYTGRDKRVWYSLYKTYWLLDFYYIISLGAAIICVIIPFYYEVNYEVAHIISWWHWFSRVFFVYIMFTFALVSLLLYWLQLNLRWLFWKKALIVTLCVIILITYLLYTQFVLTCFSYFTDPVWFHRNRTVDYIQLSHEPFKWGWGTAKRDHFTYHNTKTSLWFKSDGPYAAAIIFIHFFLFGSLFFIYVFWLVLFRRLYATSEVSISFFTYAISAIQQYFYLYFLFYILIGFSFGVMYLRLPFEDYNLVSIDGVIFFYNDCYFYLINYVYRLVPYTTVFTSFLDSYLGVSSALIEEFLSQWLL